MVLMREAPRLSRKSDYPLSGVKTGPAWRAMWKLLEESPGWVSSRKLRAAALAASPDMAEATANNLLYVAAGKGVIGRRRQGRTIQLRAIR